MRRLLIVRDGMPDGIRHMLKELEMSFLEVSLNLFASCGWENPRKTAVDSARPHGGRLYESREGFLELLVAVETTEIASGTKRPVLDHKSWKVVLCLSLSKCLIKVQSDHPPCSFNVLFFHM